jgi:hypothetical protein
MWDIVFGMVNLGAVLGWIVLILLPRHPAALSGVLYLGVGVLCLIYSVALIGVLSGLIPNTGGGSANFLEIEGVRAIFESDAGVVIGWTHYLAFDLFAGLWIAKDADAKQFNRIVQAPILLLTFLAGPVGLGIWLIVRERRARRLS